MAEPVVPPSSVPPSPLPPYAPPSALSSVSAPPPSGHLRGLIMAKEKELHDINEYRIQTLETLLAEKEREISDGKGRMSKLKEDFAYNLRLLEERDAELERYDASFGHLKAVIRDRDIENSELKIASAELQHAVKQERDRATESEAYYQQKLVQLREEAEAARWKLDDEARTQRDEFEGYKREQQRIAREAQEVLERERREAAAAYDEASRKREIEHAQRVEGLEGAVRAAEEGKRNAELTLKEARQRHTTEEEKIEDLSASLRAIERGGEEREREASRREARDTARLEELEREKTALERAKVTAAEEHTVEVEDLKRRLQAAERASNSAKDQLEGVRATAANEMTQAQLRLESKVGEMRSRQTTLEEDLAQATHRVAEARRERDEFHRVSTTTLEAERRNIAMELQGEREKAAEALGAMGAELEEAKHRAGLGEAAAEASRREVAAARAEMNSTHDALAESRNANANLKAQLADLEEKRELGAAEKHEEMISNLQGQRDAANHKMREAEAFVAELEGKVEAAKAEATRSASLMAAAEARATEAAVEVAATQEEMHRMQKLLQEQEHHYAGFGKSGGRGGRSAAVADDEESLPSPVSIPSLPVSPMLGGGGGGGGGSNKFAGAAALEAENGRLRAKVSALDEAGLKSRQVIAEMRAEVERLRSGDSGGGGRLGGKGEADELSALDAEKVHLVAYTELLQMRCDELSRGVAGGDANQAEVRMLRVRVKTQDENAARLRAQLRDAQQSELRVTQLKTELANARLERPGGAVPESVSGVVTQLQTKLTEVTAALADRTSECEALRSQRDGGGLVQTLQAKLTQAEADLTRLVAEREKLMEISNMLRADLNKVLSESFVAPSATAAAERAEREVASRYEGKLTEIESSMRELVGQNRALKDELRRWTAEGTELAQGGAMPLASSRSRRATPRTAGPAPGGRSAFGAALGAGGEAILGCDASPWGSAPHSALRSRHGGPSALEEPGSLFGGGASGYLGDATAEEGEEECEGDAADGEDEEREEDEEEDEEGGAGGLPTGGGSARVASADRARQRIAARTSLGPARPSTAPSPGMDDSAKGRARAKLDEARSSLQLSGSAFAGVERPAAVGQSARVTSSQSKARLADIQRKRAELIRKRQLVRNYNDTD